MSLNLVYDRTQEDVTSSAAIRSAHQTPGGYNWSGVTDAERARLERGTLTYNTLNRVESATKLLAAALTSAGYPVEVEPVLKGSSRLPSGYTEVEYIESSGGQYIDTGIIPGVNAKIYIDYDVISAGSDDVICGVIAPNICIGYSTTRIFGAFKNGTGESTGADTTVVGRHSAEISNGKFVLDGTSYSFSTISSYSTTRSIFLFAGSYSGVAGGVYGKVAAKIYACKIYDGDSLVRDFVPCKNPDGVAGLYDLVGGTFYINAGTGTFIAGADIVGFTAGAENREWQEGDIIRRGQWTTYLSNVQKLRDAYYTLAETGQLPEPEDKLGYESANNIEKILADIDLLIDCMKSSYRRCGTFRAGNNAVHLPLKGSI